jgi:hypothetical protein
MPTRELAPIFAFPDRCDARFAALVRLLKHDCFFRVCIRQEMVFGKTVHIRCGSWWMDWVQFSGAITLFVTLEHSDLAGRRGFWHFQGEPYGVGQIYAISIPKDRIRLQEQLGLEKPRLCDLVADLWMMRASDPRDMIYGLLGLSRKVKLPELSPEYKQTDAGELYTDVAQLFLKRKELLDTLYVAGVGYTRKVVHLPSWVQTAAVPQKSLHYELRRPSTGLQMVPYPTFDSFRQIFFEKEV